MRKFLIFISFAVLLAAMLATAAAAETAEGGENTLLSRLLIAFGIGLAVAIVTVVIMVRRMSTVRAAKTADGYVKKNSFCLTESRDIYLYSRISRVRVNNDRNK